MRRSLALIFALVLASCDEAANAEPLIAGTAEGSYDGVDFTVVNGFATVSEGEALIVIGDGPIGCGSEAASEPPRGHNAAIHPPALEVGTYATVFVQMFSNVGSFEGVGANAGSLEITSVSDETVAGTVSFDYTDAGGRSFALSGTFEVVHCAY